MNKTTADADPDYTKIGDKQYHHFQVEIPEGASNLVVTLDGDYQYDLNLYLHPGNFAFNSTAQYKTVSSGAYKEITIPLPAAGTWYVGVECATTVTAEKYTWSYDYSGDLSVLNGVSYSITASWSE